MKTFGEERLLARCGEGKEAFAKFADTLTANIQLSHKARLFLQKQPMFSNFTTNQQQGLFPKELVA